jgi:ABC-type bacteriocin/lantibiotic exporter with double-glycine peptidase domain
MNIIKYFIHIIKKIDTKGIYIVFIFGLIAAILEGLSFSLIVPIASYIIDPGYSFNSKIINSLINIINLDTSKVNISLILYLFILLILCKNLILIAQLYYRNYFFNNIKENFTNLIFKKELEKQYIHFSGINSSKIIRNVGMSESPGYLLDILSQLITEIFFFVAIIIILFLVNTKITFFSLLIFSFFSYIYYYFISKKLKSWGRSQQDSYKTRLKILQETIDSIKEFKLLGVKNFFFKDFYKANFKYFQSGKKIVLATSAPKYLLEIFVIILITLYLVFKNQNISINVNFFSTLSVFAVASLRLMPTTVRILSYFTSFAAHRAQLEILYGELSDNKFRDIDRGGVIKKKDIIKIELKNIIFSYQNSNKKIINNVSLNFRRGFMYGIKGSSGSGKTTLLNIICGLLKPDKGFISVNGKIVRENVYKNFSIGYVSQKPFILDASFSENILFGIDLNLIDKELFNQSLKISSLETTIHSFQNKENTNIGQEGKKISVGQIQRVGLARIIYHNPSLIILDEPTSALDSKTEVIIMNNLLKYKKNKIIIVVSHKNYVLKKCDKIISL